MTDAGVGERTANPFCPGVQLLGPTAQQHDPGTTLRKTDSCRIADRARRPGDQNGRLVGHTGPSFAFP